MRSDRFFITGSTGFIGACLTHELVRQNKDVSILVRNKKNIYRINSILKKVNVYEGDLNSPSLRKIVNKIKPTVVFNLAAYGTRPDQENINTLVDVNIKGTFNLLQAVKDHDLKLFIHGGSSSEYGIKTKPMNELNLLIPLDSYGVTKAIATLFCQKIAIRERMPIVIFRLFSPYGYYEDEMRLVPYVIINALKQNRMRLSDPKKVRDFIFIEDVINAYMKALKNTFKPYGQIINIGSGIEHTIDDVVKTVLEITQSNSRVEWNVRKNKETIKEPKNWQADIKYAEKELHWKPQHTLHSGLTKTINWFKRNRN